MKIMIVTDSLVRRVSFTSADFFKSFMVVDATRSNRHEIEDNIELPRSFLSPYFVQGKEVNISVKDLTPNRERERKFNFAFFGKLFYRKDLEEIITITIGNRNDNYLRSELQKMHDFYNDPCGTYFLILEVPKILISELEKTTNSISS